MYLTVLFLLVLLTILYSVECKKKSVQKKDNQTISPWEYCEGCKVTVDLYSQLSQKKLAEMQAAGVKHGTSFDANTVIPGMCDNEDFASNYAPAMKWSCIKIIEENATKFLLPFEGDSSAAGAKIKLFDTKREVRRVTIFINKSK